MKYLAHAVITLALFTGCSGIGFRSASNEKKIYAVTADNAAFFRYGPQQGNGPDRTLPRDTLVRLIRSSWGYSKVQVLDDNQQGYISTEEISAAPANLIAAASATPAPSAPEFDLNSNDPRLTAPPETLPAPDLPPPPDLPSAPDAAPAASPQG